MILTLAVTSAWAQISTQFRGRAFVGAATAAGTTTYVADTGGLPLTGGTRDVNLLKINAFNSNLQADIAHAYISGVGDHTIATATAANVRFLAGGNIITARLLSARASAISTAGSPMTAGSSEILDLRVNGTYIFINGRPNQKINIPGGFIVINEQYHLDIGSQTVIALHVIMEGILDVKLSHVNAGIGPCDNCNASCSGTSNCNQAVDSINGSGLIRISADTEAQFGVAFRLVNGVRSGSMTLVDTSVNVNFKVTAITSITVVSRNVRRIHGLADINGTGNLGFVLTLTDNGEPGTQDHLDLVVGTRYRISAYLDAGFLRIELPCNSI